VARDRAQYVQASAVSVGLRRVWNVKGRDVRAVRVPNGKATGRFFRNVPGGEHRDRLGGGVVFGCVTHGTDIPAK
jgi:hypothetical protein